MTAVTGEELDIARLRALVDGAVLAPGDKGYDTARTVVQGGVDDRPAVIVRVAGTADIRTVIQAARETGLELAVRCGGHSSAAHSTVEGGIVIDVRDLTTLDVDVPGRVAWVGAGLAAGDVAQALAEHGLAIGFGDTASVGVAGITLGGGIGYLVRKYGLTIDSLLAAEVVTARGEVIVADATTHPDLFWGLRGGGGNFGVVTRFRFRLQELPGIVGGMLLLPATAASIAGFVAAAAAAPEELSVIANVMPCPPMPFVPEARHGDLVILALVCWSGDVATADGALAPLRAVAEPIADLVRPMAYPEMYPPEEGDYHPLAVSRTVFLDEVEEADAAVMVDALNASDAAMRVVQLRPLGGAMATVPADATAFAHRNRAVLAVVASFYTGPDDRERYTSWVVSLATAIGDGPAGYVNFLADEGEARIRAAYPHGAYERLAAIKRTYDPENLFRRNQNIAPAQ